MRRLAPALFGLCWITLAQAQDAALEAGKLYETGTKDREAGRLDKAIRELERSAALKSDNADTQVQLGVAYSAKGRWDAAETAYRKALNLTPTYSDARLGLAQLAFWRKQLDRAQSEADKALALAPKNRETQNLIVQIRQAKIAQKAVIEASAFKRRIEAAQTLRQAKKFAEAETLFRALTQEKPRDAGLWIELGTTISYQDKTRREEARAAFHKALDIDPKALDAKLSLARLDIWDEKPDEALSRIDEVLEAKSDNLEALSLRARVLLMKGEVEDSERAFRHLTPRNGKDPELYLGLGDSLRGQLRDEEARDTYELGLKLEPASEEIRERLQEKTRPRWRIDLDGSFSRLTQGNPGWREGAFHVAYDLRPGLTISGGVEESRRFRIRDTYIESRVDKRWSEDLTSYALAGFTPEADYHPRAALGLGGSYRVLKHKGLIGDTIATADLRLSHYPVGDVGTISPGFTQYFADGAVWISVQQIGTWNENERYLSGYAVQANLMAWDRLTLFVGYADAPDSSDGRTIQTKAWSGGMTFALTDRFSLKFAASREERKNSYKRTTFNTGVTMKF